MKRQLVSTVVGLQPQRREHILYHGARPRGIHLLTDVDGFLQFVNFATFATCTFGVVGGGLTWGYLIKKIKYNNVIFIE